MICMEVDGMKRVLFKILIPAVVIAGWLITCYPVCRKPGGFDLFLYWILAGFPFGIRKMCVLLIPRNFGIAGGVGVLASNGIVGGLIGGFVVIWKVLGIAAEMFRLVTGYFWTKSPEVVLGGKRESWNP